MIEPTQRQVAVLEALQNHTVAVTELLAQAAEFDGPAPQSWLVDYHHHAVARADLAAAAAAGGVPPVWIDHVQARGERGIAYRPEMYLREPDPTDWDRVLGDLTTEVARLREWAGLDVAHRDLAPDSRAAALRTNIEALRMRTAGVANLLGLDTEEGELLWGDTTAWAQEAAATLAEVPAEQITHRWRAAAEIDTRAHAGQATALSMVGIAVDTAAALPPAEQLYEAISAELDPVAPLFVSARGADDASGIDAAVAAAFPQDLDTAVDFSHPAEPEQASGYDPRDLEAIPVFLSADGAEL
ncbi:hypothetical protein [Nocardia noduli]|uniref:hypothetical protein n=1 Tax=Nocardia noduli TaxID=2815722 RepID=UPI001C226579|nr:hypothetical protein [Nocardia noduli]